MNQKKCVIGIELGSARVKAVLLDESHVPVVDGGYEWENKLENGIWTYSLGDIHKGLKAAYSKLAENFKAKYGEDIIEIGAIGISAMMHGYLVFDKDWNQLVPFRTWRNTITGQAADILTEKFGFNVPQRWSVAHLYQAMLNKEQHINDIAHITTLSGYIHYLLTGNHVLGVGDASGMFPIDTNTCDYNSRMVSKFEELNDCPWNFRDIMPRVLVAGEDAGSLTVQGAAFLDESGKLSAGIPVCPPEGDAGTGMVATNSVKERTGNVSAGTSDFAMVVTDHELGVHKEIDMVTTPEGATVAMVHCNNCTSDINAYVGLFSEVLDAMGAKFDRGEIFTNMFKAALKGDKDCGGLVSYNYLSGEGITELDEGRPLFLRRPDSKLSLANFMRMNLYSALATLKIGMDILDRVENVKIDKIYGHGGYFKTPVVGQTFLSAAINAPVSVMETAGEGGAYGMALLAAYRLEKRSESLDEYLENKIFADAKSTEIMADPSEVEGFNTFVENYKRAFDVEKKAVEVY